MGMTEESTRERLVGIALARLIDRGYAGASVDDICREASLGKGSFYYHFKSKEDLALAALERYFAEGAAVVMNPRVLTIGEPRERALALVDHIERISKDRWGHGCLLGALALELGDDYTAIRQRIAAMLKELQEALAPHLAAFDRTKSGGSSAAELADMLVMLIEGGVVMSEAYRDPHYIPAAIRRFHHYLTLLDLEGA